MTDGITDGWVAEPTVSLDALREARALPLGVLQKRVDRLLSQAADPFDVEPELLARIVVAERIFAMETKRRSES